MPPAPLTVDFHERVHAPHSSAGAQSDEADELRDLLREMRGEVRDLSRELRELRRHVQRMGEDRDPR